MKLIVLHRILISTGIAFCLGFGLLMGLRWRDDGEMSSLGLAALFLAAAVALGLYLKNLSKFVRID